MPRIDRFDGLRAVLVLAVMAHHVEASFKGSTAPVFKAGWLPVDGFFVLSGFLIASVLLREWSNTGALDIGRFLFRRLARLYPALLVVLVAIGGIAVRVDSRSFGATWPSLVSSASYLHNFNYLRISPLLTEVGPFWSLSIEVQFYVGFVLLASVLLASGASRPIWVGIVVAVAVTSATVRARLGVGHYPESYLGTSARLDSLMWGVLVALAFQWGWLVRVSIRLLRVVGPVAIAVLVWMYVSLHAFDVRTYDWGISVAGVASALLVMWLVRDDRSWCAGALAWRPLVAVGRRSYSAYLWHQAVFLFLARHTASGPWSRPIVGFVVTFALADLTYRFVERPGVAWSRQFARPPVAVV